MATIAELVRIGILEEFELPEWHLGLPIRSLYATPELFDKVDGDSRWRDGSLRRGERTPLEHLQQLFADFRCSEHPHVTEFCRLRPTAKGIWEAKPPMSRVFGWCAAPWTFVAVQAELEVDVKATRSMYRDNMQSVQAFISQHRLSGEVVRGDHRAVFPGR